MFGTLYVVATPVGNLHDITLRAVETLEKATFIVCEDTRRSTILLNFIERDLHRPFISTKRPHLLRYHEEQEWKLIPHILQILQNGENVALVSDAGTPTISDPGFKLVRECIQQGIRVESIPGASAVLTALVSSGLPTDKFLFLGFLPHKEGNRKKLLENVLKSLEYTKATVILYEAPHRLKQTLEELQTLFGDIPLVVSRELTKIHEETIRGNISEVHEHFNKKQPKGEFVILFHLLEIGV